MKVLIGLGGNLGDPSQNIRLALEMMEDLGLGEVVRMSSMYRTEPVGITDQPWFINAAAAIDTDSSPEAFHAGLKEIEYKLGRPEERIKNGPRPIDLDILLWGEEVIDSPGLTVPHPRMHERSFVLAPLAEIAPDALHPTMKKTVNQLSDELKDAARVERVEEKAG